MLKAINDVKVVPINVPKLDEKRIVGSKVFPEIYANIYISAKKMSGKTNAIFTIIKQCCDKNSNVIVFCSTCNKDTNWIEIKKYLEIHDIPSKFYDSIVDGEANHLKELIEIMSVEDEPEEEEEIDLEPHLIFADEEIRIKLKKPKKISQKYLIIFDDISAELKDPNVSVLLKQNRHYKSKVIISSQYVNDIVPQSRRQIQYYLLFGGINDLKLNELYTNMDLPITFIKFCELYKDATKERFNFFYVDTSGKYRKNFNLAYVI